MKKKSKAYIICIDDEQSVLNQLSAQLSQKFGQTHEIEIAESAEEALELLEELKHSDGEDIALVICDQIMPGMKGDQFLTTINSHYPEIKKILLTGQAGLESAIYAINNANLDKYIEKPWEIEDLALTIRTLIEQYELKKKIALYTGELEEKNKFLLTLHQLAIELNTKQQRDTLIKSVLHACEVLSGNTNVIYFHSAGIEKLAPVAAEIVNKELLDLLAQGYRRTVESALKSSIPLTIDHSTPNEYFPEPYTTRFPSLKITHWFPVATQDKYLGAICMIFSSPPTATVASTLSILANQFATTLFNLDLTSETIKSERLATIGQMISSIIHDFKNPMTTIKGLVGLMGDSEFTLEDRKTYSDMVIEEVDRVVGMVNELLEFSRGGRGEFRKADTSFPDIMEKICTVYEKEFFDKGISLEKEILYTGQIQLDTEKIKRAFFNIIDNARDAMVNGGKLRVRAYEIEDGVEITLTDTGGGMPPEVQARIFEPFVTHGKIHGTGLGMAITKKIIDDHRGFITLNCEEGVGTTFTIRLPFK